MAISVFPAPVTSSLNANAITATAADVLYEGRATFESGVYTVTCASGVVTNFQFFNGGTSILSSVTASGTVSINLASTADRVRLYTNTGTNTVVTITKTANSLTNQFSGTLETVTTLGSSTYTGTSTSGYAYAILIGGGAGATGSSSTKVTSGASGGGIAGKFVTLTGSMALTIGAGGVGGVGSAGGNLGTSGGASTFAGMTANGGVHNPASPTTDAAETGVAGGTATGGDINVTGASGGNAAVVGSATTATWQWVKSGTTGSGGGGGGSAPNKVGGGSGIGTGGTGGNVYAGSLFGTSATGYGAGGGGAAQGGYNGGNGSQGVLYVLKF